MSYVTKISKALLVAVIVASAGPALAEAKLKDVTIVYPTPGSTSWPIWFAEAGGYFKKYGLNVKVELAMHPAGPAAVASGEALTHNLGLDSAMLAAMKGDQFVLISSPLNKGQFVLLANKNVPNVQALATLRVAVGRVGDPPYHYGLALLDYLKVPTKDINWVSAGTPPQRALAVKNGLADAALLTPPDYYTLVDEGYKVVANLADYPEVPIATTYMFQRKVLEQTPELVEAVLKAHIEGVKRFYDDKAFAMATIKKYSKVKEEYLSRLYDDTAKAHVLERVPYVRAATIKAIVERGAEQTPAMAKFDFRKAIPEGPMDKIVAEGFFETLYGPSIKAEVAAARAASFR
jgi:ABC-type nitrate/sulfonate/bicarbonate transport system substrate-binding protein